MAKLKVYRTSAGFDDAYVAASSQKAALAAWGADADLFARGVAEVVDDPGLMREPLARPGKVIRVRRGTTADHLKALDKASAPKRRRSQTRAGNSSSANRKNALTASTTEQQAIPPPRKSRLPKPDRAALDRMDKAIADAKAGWDVQLKDFAARRRALEREEREARQTFEAALARMEKGREKERQRFSERLAAWAADED